MRARRFLLMALGVGALMVALGVGLGRTASHDPRVNVSFDRHSRQLAFTLPLFSGGELSSQSLQGRPVILNFYASWCVICSQEMPDFQRIAQDGRGLVTVVGVNPQSNDNDVRQAALVAETGIDYPTVRDRDDLLLRVFDTSGALPVTVFVDSTGAVVRVINGQLTEGKIARILAADFGLQVSTQTPDRSTLRTRGAQSTPSAFATSRMSWES